MSLQVAADQLLIPEEELALMNETPKTGAAKGEARSGSKKKKKSKAKAAKAAKVATVEGGSSEGEEEAEKAAGASDRASMPDAGAADTSAATGSGGGPSTVDLLLNLTISTGLEEFASAAKAQPRASPARGSAEGGRQRRPSRVRWRPLHSTIQYIQRFILLSFA